VKVYLILIFSCLQFVTRASSPRYHITIKDRQPVHIEASFSLLNDTIFMYQRGTTAELPEGEVGFVKNLSIKNSAGQPISYRYTGDGNWVLNNVRPADHVTIAYDILTTHKQYNWDHTGGVDENAFTTSDGLFFTGYTLFILPDVNMQNIEVNFNLPQAWKASTPWQKKNETQFIVENGRFLLNNCLMIGKHEERIIRAGDMEMRLAVESKLAYSIPLLERTMQKIIEFYQQLFGGSPAPVYLVALNEERMTDGSAFRRSFSQIFKDTIEEKGLPAWGHILAHEILHLWNGHAIIPGTQEEWFKEGFTDYITVLALRQTNLVNDEITYRKLEHIARRYWLDRYWQRDTLSIRNTGNQKAVFRFGVYGGGAAVALALDIEMRKATNNQKGVVDLMGRMFNDFAMTKKTYSLNDIIRIVNDLAGKNLQSFFDRYVTGTEILELRPYMQSMGLDYNAAIEEVYVTPNKAATSGQKLLYQSIFWQSRQ
jgi:predicted metalloprotease with PDZ domain